MSKPNSFKHHKNNNILLSIGYILTFAILTFVLFSVLAFDVEFKNREENTAISNVLKVEASNMGFAFQFGSIYKNQELDSFQIETSQERVVSQTITNGKFPSIIQLDGEKKLIYDKTFDIKFVDLELSSGIVPTTVEKELVKRTESGFIKEGTGFAGNGAGQLLLSEAMLKELNLGSDCIGKKLSITLDVPLTKFDNYTSGYAENITVLDDDNIAGNKTGNSVWNGNENYVNIEFQGGKIKIFENFVIMGMINEEYEQIDHNTADVWMAMPSLCKENNTYLPKMSYSDIYNENGGTNKARIITYQNTDLVDLSNRAAAEGMVFPFFLRGGYVSETISKWSPINICDPITTYEVGYKNYKQLKNIYTNHTKGQGNVSVKINQDIVDMLRYDEEHKVIKIILLIIGCIIGIISYTFSSKEQHANRKLITSVLIGSTVLSLTLVVFQCFAFNNFGGLQNWNSGLMIIFYPLAWFIIQALTSLPLVIKSIMKQKSKEKKNESSNKET